MNNPLNANTANDPFKGAPSFPLVHRLTRLLWNVTWLLLASWTPAPLHRWRVLLLNLFGARVHSKAHVYSSARIWFPAHLHMGPYACLGPQTNCYNMAPITLCAKAVVSQGAHLCAGTHDIDAPYHQLITQPIRIEDNAWIAAEAFIGPGVTIQARAVVGARAVMFKDAEQSGVYAGNPARLIRYRKTFE